MHDEWTKQMQVTSYVFYPSLTLIPCTVFSMVVMTKEYITANHVLVYDRNDVLL